MFPRPTCTTLSSSAEFNQFSALGFQAVFFFYHLAPRNQHEEASIVPWSPGGLATRWHLRICSLSSCSTRFNQFWQLILLNAHYMSQCGLKLRAGVGNYGTEDNMQLIKLLFFLSKTWKKSELLSFLSSFSAFYECFLGCGKFCFWAFKETNGEFYWIDLLNINRKWVVLLIWLNEYWLPLCNKRKTSGSHQLCVGRPPSGSFREMNQVFWFLVLLPSIHDSQLFLQAARRLPAPTRHCLLHSPSSPHVPKKHLSLAALSDKTWHVQNLRAPSAWRKRSILSATAEKTLRCFDGV